MAEVFATISAAAALAAESIKLSKTIYVFVNEVKDTSQEARGIADEIQATSTLLDQFSTNLKREEENQLCILGFYDSAKRCVDACERVFAELRATITAAVPGISFSTADPDAFVARKRDQLKWPFSRTDVNRHSNQLRRAKADLQLIVVLMIETHHLYDRQEADRRRRREQKLERERRFIERQLLSNDMKRLELQAQMADYALQSDDGDFAVASSSAAIPVPAPVSSAVAIPNLGSPSGVALQIAPEHQPDHARPELSGAREPQPQVEGATNASQEPAEPAAANNLAEDAGTGIARSPSIQGEAAPPPFEDTQSPDQAPSEEFLVTVEEEISATGSEGGGANETAPEDGDSTPPTTISTAQPPARTSEQQQTRPPRSKRSMLRNLWRRKPRSNTTTSDTVPADTDTEYQTWSWKIDDGSADGNRLPLPQAEMASLARDFASKGTPVNEEYARLEPWLFRVLMRQLDRLNAVASEPWAVAAVGILPRRARMADVRDVRAVLSRRRRQSELRPGDEAKFLFLNYGPNAACKVPWRIAHSYEEMHELLRRLFRSGPDLRAVEEVRYSLFGPNNDILLPELWSDVIQPGWLVTVMIAQEPDRPVRLPPLRQEDVEARRGRHGTRRGRDPNRHGGDDLMDRNRSRDFFARARQNRWRRARSRSRSRSPQPRARDDRRGRRPPLPPPPRFYPDDYGDDDDDDDDNAPGYYPPALPPAGRRPPDYDGYYAPYPQPLGIYDERVYRAEIDGYQHRRAQEDAERSRREYEETAERARMVEEENKKRDKEKAIAKERREREEIEKRELEFKKAVEEETKRRKQKEEREHRAKREAGRRAESGEEQRQRGKAAKKEQEEADPLASLLKKYTVLELVEEPRKQRQEEEDSDGSDESESAQDFLVKRR